MSMSCNYVFPVHLGQILYSRQNEVWFTFIHLHRSTSPLDGVIILMRPRLQVSCVCRPGLYPETFLLHTVHLSFSSYLFYMCLQDLVQRMIGTRKKKSSPCTENSKDVLLSPWYTQRNCYGFLFLGQFWLVAGYELLPIIGFTC